MPRKEKKKKKLKPIQVEKAISIKHFNPSAEKQVLFKEFSTYYHHWTSWQRKILLCRCTAQSSLSLLSTLSTIMEPVFHRDYQIINSGSYQSNLISVFSMRSDEVKVREEPSANLKINSQNKKWHLPLLQQNNELFRKDNISSAFIDTVHKDYFDGIELNEIPEQERGCHSHSIEKHKDSVSTLDFFWKYKSDKVDSLGAFVKVPKQTTRKVTNNISEYKHKTWFLPPINSSQSLKKASRGPLLKSFKDSLKDVIVSYSKWTNAEQGDFFLTLLRICSPEEIVYLGSCIQQRLKDIWDVNRLTDNLLLKVFDYLDNRDLSSCSQTCNRWKFLAYHSTIWKPRCYDLAEQYNQYPVLQHLESISKDVSWKNIYQELDHTVQQLVDEMVLQPPSEVGVEQSVIDGAHESLNVEEFTFVSDEDENEFNEEALDDGSVASSTSSLSFEENMEILHLSPTKSFGTLENDPSKNQSTSPSTSRLSLKNNKDESQKEVTEQNIHDQVDYAFDVRPKLVQPANKMNSQQVKVLKKAAQTNIEEVEEFVHVPIQGVTTLKRVRKLQGHLEAVLCLQFDKKRVMTGSLDRTVRLWDVRSGRNFYKLKGHKGGVRCLQFDNEYIVTGSWDTTVMIWHISRFTLLHTITEHNGSISCLELSSDFLLTGSHDTTVCVFERDTWMLLHKLTGHTGPVSSMVVVSDEELLTGSHDMRVLLWNFQTGCQLKEFRHPSSIILTVKICGNLVVAGCLDGTLSFWDKQTSNLEGSMQAHNGALHAICFIGARFVTGGADGLVKEWDLGTCTCVRSLTGHKGPVMCIRASPKRIISGSADGTVRIWDMVCALQQVGGPYDEINRSVIPSEVINERDWKDKRLLYENSLS